jgi:hypothetical protein
MSHLLHGGPLAGTRIESGQMPRSALKAGKIPMPENKGEYVRDERSAGGRDWDWRPT